MWFARLFGGRADEGEDDPPTATAVVRPANPEAVTRPPARPAVKAPVAPAKGTKPKGNFDPYNSGSFERRNAWERIGRR
jgi:hypothetical protein